MPSMNDVQIAGHLTKDPDTRYTANGTAVSNFSVAVNRTVGKGTPNQKQEVTYFHVVAWRTWAESVSRLLHKGSPVYVRGWMKCREYDSKDGQRRKSWEVQATYIIFPLSKAQQEVEGVFDAKSDDGGRAQDDWPPKEKPEPTSYAAGADPVDEPMPPFEASE